MKNIASSLFGMLQAVVLWLVADTRRVSLIILAVVLVTLLSTFVLIPDAALAMPMATSGGP